MGQAGGDPDFAEEALRFVAPGARPQHLDRHLPRVLEVFGEVNRGGAAASDLLLDPVAVGDRGAETVGTVGHDP